MVARGAGGDFLSVRLALVLALGSWLAGGAAALGTREAPVTHGPVPAWVKPLELDLEVSSEGVDVSDGMHHLLMDMQESVLQDPPATYHHQAWRVLGETGVQNGSSIRIEFDPSYERIVLHDVRVHRDGRVLPRFRPEGVRLLQREERLDAQIYDGTVTALYFVEGVHGGDVVEHSYTRHGLNPTFGGRWAAGIGVRWSVPVARDHYRLLWPRERTLRVRAFGTGLSPRRSERGEVLELSWEQGDVPALLVESDVPAWNDTWPWIQLSEWADWGQVADWGRGLFEPAEPLPEELREIAAAWQSETRDPRELARRALRLVQDDVRYLGLEFGPNAYRPSEPATVYERRFGDCKDKSVLLVQLLRALGLEAAPALVDTVEGRRLPELLPTPLAFDHAVVRLRLENTDHWLDATRIHERGPIARLGVPNWGWALVLEEDGSGLTEVRARDYSRTRIDEVYESADYESPALFRVRTAYEAGDADAVREYLAGSSREEVQAAYREFYASLWADIEAVRPLEVEDDEDANVLVTTEQYRLGDFWRSVGADERREASVWSLVLDDQLVVPTTVMRTRPVEVEHPVRIEQHTELRLPEPWSLDVRDVRVRDIAFRFDHEARTTPDGRVRLLHRYETLRDFVPASRAAEYRDDVERARASLGLTLTVEVDGNASSGPSLEWPLAWLLAVALGAAAALALLVHSRRRSTEDPSRREGGLPWDRWLPLGVLVLASPLLGLWRALRSPEAFLRSEWRALTHPELGEPFSEALVLSGLLGGACLVGLGLLAGLEWARRGRGAPRLVALFLAVFLGFEALDATLRVLASGDLARALLELGRWLLELLAAGLLGGWLLLSEVARRRFGR